MARWQCAARLSSPPVTVIFQRPRGEELQLSEHVNCGIYREGPSGLQLTCSCLSNPSPRHLWLKASVMDLRRVPAQCSTRPINCPKTRVAMWDGGSGLGGARDVRPARPGQGGPRWDGLASHARRLSQARPADGSLPPAVCTLQPAASTRAGRAHPITRTLGYPQNEEPPVADVNGARC